MTPAQLETVEGIFHAALDRERDEVDAFLETACKGDELLRNKVEALIASHRQAGRFIETSVASLAARIVEQRDLRLGQTIGHYQISKRIGTGGMGEVYLALDLTAGRQAALKLLPTRFTGEAERVKRFQQEARAVVGLNHPNILTVYEIGEADSTYYIASELIDGETLRERLRRGDMQLSEAVDVAIQVASALAAAHEAGIVHRDIKPENIMLRPDGYVKVLDFGIAKLVEQELPVTVATDEALSLAKTNLGSILGTLRYMSPEQARGAAVDKGTDIWSLGVVLYEMITGHAPFKRDTPGEAIASVLQDEPPPLTPSTTQCSAELQQIISKALHKDRAQRYAGLRDFLEALKSLRRKMDFEAESERSKPAPLWLRWKRSPAAVAAVALVAALGLALPLFWHRNLTNPPSVKSIAVLPFENLSAEKENAFFADGVQDDILTSLAKISALKVISRTSVMQYRGAGAARNLREIAQALGVAHILEGTVGRIDNRALINVQLIDARNGRPIWSERYDRTIADSIGLQGELATEIAGALKAKLAPEEKARLATKPTTSPEAYLLYLRALERGRTAALKEDAFATDELYAKAIELDPVFALAIARRSMWNCVMYNVARRPAHKATALALAAQALQLSPDLPEAHVALGLCFFRIEKDYPAALREFSIAAEAGAMEPDVIDYLAEIYCQQGRWREGLATYDRAQELDPRNAHRGGPDTRAMLRDWPAAAAAYERLLKIAPDNVQLTLDLAYVRIAQGDLAAAQRLLEGIPPGLRGPPGQPSMIDVGITTARFELSMLARDYAGAEKVLADYKGEEFGEPMLGRKPFFAGRLALARGDLESAKVFFEKARPIYEKEASDYPDDARRRRSLGRLYAFFGRKDDATREGLRAVELCPESKDAIGGPAAASILALVYARTGEVDQAVALVERLLTIPGSLTLVDLRLNWEWDPLRSNARFQKILAGPEPKTIYN